MSFLFTKLIKYSFFILQNRKKDCFLAVIITVKKEWLIMPKRGENIYKRKDGRWEGRYKKYDSNGSVKWGYVYAKTYREVRQKLQEVYGSSCQSVKQDIEVKTQQQPADYFESVALEWLSCTQPQIKQSSYVKYRNMIQLHLIPRFGDHRITAVTRENVNQFCSELLMGDDEHAALSPKSVTSIISVMKNIFEYAEQVKKYDVINLNGISVKQTPKRLRILSVNEQQKLCDYLFENFNLCNFGILLSLYTGLRIGEICALKWEDVLFDERVLYVHQTMQRLQITNSSTFKTEISVSSPKSECSMRKIPIPDKLYDFMVQYRQSGRTYFLTGLKDKYIEPRTMQNRFKKALQACEIEDANFHALRHTFATRCVELGFDLKSLSEILGHSNVNITLNRYVHPSMELKQQNMNLLSDLLTVK